MNMDLMDKLEKYLEKAKPLFEGLEVDPESKLDPKVVKRFRDMTLGYYSDALHFREKGEYVNALAALEYAEGWLDAGKAAGVFK